MYQHRGNINVNAKLSVLIGSLHCRVYAYLCTDIQGESKLLKQHGTISMNGAGVTVTGLHRILSLKVKEFYLRQLVESNAVFMTKC